MGVPRLLILLIVLLAGCGAQAAGPASVVTSNGPFRAEASPAHLAAGGTVQVTLTVTGPIQYEAGCVQTFGIWVVDSQNRQVWAQPVPQVECFALMNRSLAAGQTASFHANWPTSATLAAGRYTIHGLFLTVVPLGAGARVRENMPPLTVTLTS